MGRPTRKPNKGVGNGNAAGQLVAALQDIEAIRLVFAIIVFSGVVDQQRMSDTQNCSLPHGHGRCAGVGPPAPSFA